MKNSTWKIAAAIGLAAVIVVLAVVLIVTRHDAPPDSLPEPDAPSAAAQTPEPSETPPPAPTATPLQVPDKVTFIGDSIMVAAESALHEYIPDCVVNAKEGRQLVEAMDILYDMEAAGEIYDTVVIGLGSNSPFPIEDGEEVLDFLGEDRTIYWVTCYGRYLDWQDEVNDLIWELDAEYDNLHVLDWSAVAPEHTGWIRSDDGIHLTPDGTVGYAKFVAEALGFNVEDAPETDDA